MKNSIIAYRGQDGENALFDYIKENYDNNAELQGGMNSHDCDIFSPVLGIIEVKDLPAQSGQFTVATAKDYNFSNEIMNAFGKNPINNAVVKDNNLCIKWIRDYYVNTKKVNYFGVREADGTIHLQTPDEYFSTHTFECVVRYKKSGSSSAAKWVDDCVPAEWGCYREGSKLYAPNANPGDSCVRQNTRKNDKVLWVNKSNEVRILSDTNNLTYIFNVK